MKLYRQKYNENHNYKSTPRIKLTLSELKRRKRQRKRLYMRKRWLDPQFRLNSNISRRIRASIHTRKYEKGWREILGFDLSALKAHLESQFQEGMTWDNYGMWHIDHIKPICQFSYEKIIDKEFCECWSLNNLRPLWAKDNLKRRYE